MSADPRGESGNALPIVLAFAAIGMIVVTTYLSHQGSGNALAGHHSAVLQAELNARSGIYRALDYLSGGYDFDSLKSFSTESKDEDDSFGNDFGMGMFDNAGTNDDADESAVPTVGGGAKTIPLYKDDSTNTADIDNDIQGLFSRIRSSSTVRDVTRSAEAMLGCLSPAMPDTVLILENDLPAKGRFKGTVHHNVNLPNASAAANSVNEKINSFITKQRIRHGASAEDTAMFGFPLTIQTTAEAANIPDTVNTHLTLDGAFSGASWRERREIVVYGDLQITGSFRVENPEFHVAGEVRILDKATLSNVHINSARSIFIGDNAVFHGSAISMGGINVYGSAEIKKGSSLIALGGGGASQKSARYSLFLSENSTFDGTAIAIGSPGGIKTEQYTRQTGILWAQKAVCHGGELTGIIKADYLIDCYDPAGEDKVTPSIVKANVFTGSIAPLSSIGDYKMPFFLGIPQIISIREF